MACRDVLADVVDLLRVRGAVTAHVRAHAPWGLSLHRAPGATFHAVTAGTCWVRLRGQPAREVHAGDVVLLPRGAPHVMASSAAGPSQSWDRAIPSLSRNAAGEMVLDGPGGSTQLICAAYYYDREVAHPLVSLLPPLVIVGGQELGEGSAVQATLRLLRHELIAAGPGWSTVVNRLIDVLFVQVIRAWVATGRDSASSWLGALRDPIIARVLTAMHADPAAAWTLDLLAREASLSRATLTRRFSGLVGEAPLSYLTKWRMELAARNLRETDDSVGTIARRVGYTSEFAFSRAFSRLRGSPPGRYRGEWRRSAPSSRAGA
ncbi:MAG TPA: AraC family transcriptional regulator [Gemmatimonadales bacterium]|nr:AraC family transcriptional regulator [Gemmatimonadales bacterium]